MTAEIISIGDELLMGQTINSNAAWMGEQLNLMGLGVDRCVVIKDEEDAIVEALHDAENRASLVLITGGLGPTKDDITKHTLCRYFDTKLVMNEAVLARIEDYFKAVGREMLQTNTDQALLPESCTVLDNMQGTASGMWFERNDTIVVAMPGVPFEMKGLMNEQVLPRVASRLAQPGLVHKTLMTQGIGESFLVERAQDWEDSLTEEGIKVAYLPKPGQVRVRLTAAGDDPLALREKVDRKARELQQKLPVYVYALEEEDLEYTVGKLLLEKRVRVSTAESCTGGYLASLITKVPGASEYYPGTIVSYANEVKTSLLQVSPDTLVKHGAVSEEVVIQMAKGVREQLNTDYGIALSGIAGPSGGTEAKPVGTVWIAVAGPNGVVSKRFFFGNHRERTIRKSALTALNMLRVQLCNLAD